LRSQGWAFDSILLSALLCAARAGLSIPFLLYALLCAARAGLSIPFCCLRSFAQPGPGFQLKFRYRTWLYILHAVSSQLQNVGTNKSGAFFTRVL
jgi:hypothetical protein